MNSDDLTPPMFPTQPQFESMRIGKIRVVHVGGETVGELIPYHRPKDKLFGARIDVADPAVYQGRTAPILEDRFIAVGHFTVTSYKLPLKLLENIQKTGDPDVAIHDRDLTSRSRPPLAVAMALWKQIVDVVKGRFRQAVAEGWSIFGALPGKELCNRLGAMGPPRRLSVVDGRRIKRSICNSGSSRNN
jgi:hypothetical protein